MQGAISAQSRHFQVSAIETSDDDRLQEPGFKVPQVHSMTGAGRGFKRLPVGDDPAGLAPKVPQGSIAPDVTFGVLGVTVDRDRAKFVVGPYPSRAPT
jgi:hypothetical protein